MAKVVYDETSSYRRPSRSSSYRSETNSYGAQYEGKIIYNTQADEEQEVNLIQSRRRSQPSIENDSIEIDPSRISDGLDRDQREAKFYNARHESRRRFDDELEEVNLIQPGRRGPSSLGTGSVQSDPSRAPEVLDRHYNEVKSYDARYEVKKTYDADFEDVNLIQPGRRGPPSLETDSVRTDSSLNPMRLDRGHRDARSDARYKATNKGYDSDTVNLIQPGRRGQASADTDSVFTDHSRIPMGLDVFLNVDRFVIQQNYQSEAWWDTVLFKVTDGKGKEIVEIRQEKAANSCVQALLGKMRQFFMKAYVSNKEWIMEFEHPWSCLTPVFCPWASPSMIVRMPTGEVLGQVKNASRETCGSCLPPTKYFEVVDYEESIINVVTGPTCYPFECSRSNPASFELLKVEKSGKTYQVGDITHQWRGCCGGIASCCFTEEKETVTVTFPKECQVEDKALFLSLGFLTLFSFFEVN